MRGYIAPEYAIRRYLTHKSDVYTLENLFADSRHRFKSVEIVDEIIHLGNKWRKQAIAGTDLNKLTKEIAKLTTSGGDVRAMIQDARLKKDAITTKEARVKDTKEARKERTGKIGNLIHDSVPIGKDELQQGYRDGDEYMFTSLFMRISKSFLIDMVDVLIYAADDNGQLSFSFMMKCF
ncbi:serine--tRNA ligase [Tanacetum coccineum]